MIMNWNMRVKTKVNIHEYIQTGKLLIYSKFASKH